MIRIISIINKALQFLCISIRNNKSISTSARKRSFSKDALKWPSVLFMAVRLEKTMHFINLPASFNYEEHILNFPPEQYGFVDPRNEGFKSMRMLYILWQFGESASKHERAWKKSGFIAVSGKTFQYRVQSYNPYLKYLINTGVIESDNHYIPLVIPLGYKFAERFSNEPLRRVDLSHGSISDTFDDNVRVFAYLTYWYMQNKLTIDSDAARDEAFTTFLSIKDERELWSRNKYGIPKEPLPQYMASIQSISKIESGLFNLKISDKVHRLYSSITSMPSMYRKYLKYDNQSLGCIDIKNCQSYISCIILNPDFWKKDSTLPLNLYTLPQNVIDLFDANLIIMLGEKFEEFESLGIFSEYNYLVSNGMIYQDMILWAKQDKDKVVLKKKVKEVVFSTIFSPVNSRKTWLHDYYSQKFTPVIEIFNIIKSDVFPALSVEIEKDIAELDDIKSDELEINKPHARLAILFQAIESKIILHKCCKRIFEESNHTVPLFTVHDCIITTHENIEYLESVIIEEFTIAIGYHPPLDIEKW